MLDESRNPPARPNPSPEERPQNEIDINERNPNNPTPIEKSEFVIMKDPTSCVYDTAKPTEIKARLREYVSEC